MFIRIENICIFLDTNNTFFCFITKKVAYYSSSNPRRNCSRAVAPPVLAKESRQYYSVDYSVGTHGRNHVNLGRSSGPDPTSDFEVWPLTFPGDSYMVNLVQSQGAIISNDLVTSQFTSFIRKHNVTIEKTNNFNLEADDLSMDFQMYQYKYSKYLGARCKIKYL